MATATLNHGCRVVHRNQAHAFDIDITSHRQRRRAEGTTEIKGLRIGLDKALRQHTDCGNDIGVARYGALDHIREDFGYPFIERKIAQLGNWS